jgi:crotonobetainyl-CoA:carnitine CoA-transferase CaiB-like acyl-CoA transferase
VRFDRAPFTYPAPAPALGADTRTVLGELGMTDDEVDALVAEGAAIAP